MTSNSMRVFFGVRELFGSLPVCWGGRVSHPDAQAAQEAHWGLGAGRGPTQSTQAVDSARGLSITRPP